MYKHRVITFILTAALSTLRIVGIHGEFFQAVSHLAVGLFIGLSIAFFAVRKLDSDRPRHWYLFLAVLLTAVEIVCAIGLNK